MSQSSAMPSRQLKVFKLFSYEESKVNEKIWDCERKKGRRVRKTESPYHLQAGPHGEGQAVFMNSSSLKCPLLMTTSYPVQPSLSLVHADTHAFLDGHPADGGLWRQLRLGQELVCQDPQDRVHFLVHLMDLDSTQWQKTNEFGQVNASGINTLHISTV